MKQNIRDKKARQDISKYLSRSPRNIKDIEGFGWFYHLPKGIGVVYEIRVGPDPQRYVRTDQFVISWKQVKEALADYERAKSKSK